MPSPSDPRDLPADAQLIDLDRAASAPTGEAWPLLLAFVDAQLTYRFVNAGYHARLGGVRPRLVGLPAVSEDCMTGRQLAPALPRVLAGETVSLKVRAVDARGVERVADLGLTPRRDARGRIDGVRLVGLEVAPQPLDGRPVRTGGATQAERRVAAEAALRHAQNTEAVGLMASGLAHDFNNMLMGVQGALDVIRRRLDPGRADLDGLLDIAGLSVERAAGLARRLLDLARPRAPTLAPADLNAAVADLAGLLAVTLPPTVQILTGLAPHLPAAFIDGHQLQNALLNLAINARDAMPAGGRLTLSTLRIDGEAACAALDLAPGAYVAVAVADEGQGMDAEVAARAFEPFFTTKPPGHGTGLGLAMVAEFATASAGFVRLRSRPGQGSTVTLIFHAAEAAAAKP